MIKEFVQERDILNILEGVKNEVRLFDGARILMTGGTGFLGRYFTAFFKYINANVLKNPCEIICMDINVTGNNPNYKDTENFTFINHNVMYPTGLKLKIDQKIDYIIHLAGIASPAFYQKYPIDTLDVSYLGTKNMLELAYRDQVKSMLSFSSSEVYGTPDKKNIPTKETFNGDVPTMDSRSCYDIGKKVMETLCHVYFTEYGVPVKLVRPFNVYGCGMTQRDYRVLPNFFSNVINKRPLKVYGTGKQTRTFCYISDAMTGFIKALLIGHNGSVYNIGNPEPEITILELAQTIKKLVGDDVQVEKVDYPSHYPAAEPLRRKPDISKAKEHLYYEPKVSNEEGFMHYYNWCLENFVVDSTIDV